jgi:putative ABC transport system substrate-binding protein
MDRRTFIGRVAGGLLAGSSIADAQQLRTIPVVGVLLNNGGRSAGSSMLRAFDQGLRDLGYVDGTNIIVDIRSVGGKPGALPRLAAELVQRKVDVIYAAGPAAIQATRDATSVIPIVALDLESDPVLAGWAKSLARPGGNLTGLFVDLPGLAGKWLELLMVATPGIRRVGVLWDSTTGTAQLDAARAAAPGFALDLQVIEVRSDENIGAALTASVSAASRALILLSSPAISGQQKEIAEFALKNRPAISPFRNFADAGGLIAYGPDFNELRQRAASYVDKTLKGAKIGNLPIERPTKFEMVINLKTARKMGLTIPQSLLVRANEVIQ